MGAQRTSVVPDHEVVIIGAGFSGIGAGIKLDEAGFTNWVMLEQGDGIGGAWYWNTYPGIAVDFPSASYQFSFEINTDWSRIFARGDEVRAYAEHCVDKYGLRDRIRLATKVVGAEFDDDTHLWRLTTGGGEQISARFVVGATGILTQPKNPDIPGLGDFEGLIMHTARWDHGHDLTGKRVGLIGTGASALQVIPEIAPEVGSLVVFQRTPIWCLPKHDAEISKRSRALLRLIPGAKYAARYLSQALIEATVVVPAHFGARIPLGKLGERAVHDHLRRQVPDPELRKKLTPDYSLGCKRPSFSNKYLRTFMRDNVELETATITGVTQNGITVEGGNSHEFDVLILATGFKVFEKGNMPAFPTRGSSGIDLERFWFENRFQAYEGVSVPGFPNYFTILGPYGFNGQSYFGLIETQMRHIVRLLKRARTDGATRVEVTEQANARFFEKMLGRRGNQILHAGNCATANSYYFDEHGDTPFRAATTIEAAVRSAWFNLDDYRFETVARSATSGVPLARA